ncbi:unnamed protein product [Jaminaea pallidilutea]
MPRCCLRSIPLASQQALRLGAAALPPIPRAAGPVGRSLRSNLHRRLYSAVAHENPQHTTSITRDTDQNRAQSNANQSGTAAPIADSGYHAGSSSAPIDAAFEEPRTDHDARYEGELTPFWQSRIGHKQRYARWTFDSARLGSLETPQLMINVRQRLLRLAEAELEEESYLRPFPGETEKPQLPEQTRMASDQYAAVFKIVRSRRDLDTCAILLEDWLRFAATQKQANPTDLVPPEIIQSVAVSLCHSVKAVRPVDDLGALQQRRHDALLSLWDASEEGQILWSPVALNCYAKVLIKQGRMAKAADLLRSKLASWWDVRMELEQAAATDSSDSAEIASASRISSGGRLETSSITRLIRTLQEGLASGHDRVRQYHLLRHDLGRVEQQRSASEFLSDHLSAALIIADIFSTRLLPLPPPPLRKSVSTTEEITGSLVAELFWSFNETVGPGGSTLLPLFNRLQKETARKLIRRIKHVQARLNSFCSRFYLPSTAEEEARSSSSRIQLWHSSNLSRHATKSLIRYGAAYFRPRMDQTSRSPTNLCAVMIRKIGGIQNVQSGLLSTLLSAFMSHRDTGWENVVLHEMVRRELGQALSSSQIPPLTGDKVLSAPPHIDNLLLLLRRAAQRGLSTHAAVLLRWMISTGRIKSAGDTGAAEGEHTLARINLRKIVTIFLPGLPRYNKALDDAAAMSPEAFLAAVSAVGASTLSSPYLCSILLNISGRSGYAATATRIWRYASIHRSFARMRRGLPTSRLSTSDNAHSHDDFSPPSYFDANTTDPDIKASGDSRGDENDAHERGNEGLHSMDLESVPPVMQPEEATAFFSAIAQAMDHTIDRCVQSLDGRRGTEGSVTLLSERFGSLRLYAQQSYDELLRDWEEARKAGFPTRETQWPDKRFYNAVLSATGWPRVLKLLYTTQNTSRTTEGQTQAQAERMALAHFLTASSPERLDHAFLLDVLSDMTLLHRYDLPEPYAALLRGEWRPFDHRGDEQTISAILSRQREPESHRHANAVAVGKKGMQSQDGQREWPWHWGKLRVHGIHRLYGRRAETWEVVRKRRRRKASGAASFEHASGAWLSDSDEGQGEERYEWDADAENAGPEEGSAGIKQAVKV